MFYNANADIVFGIVFDITSEVYYGWWLRNIHANGASFFFLVVYLHMSRSVYYCSFVYPRQLLWISGSIIWVLWLLQLLWVISYLEDKWVFEVHGYY